MSKNGLLSKEGGTVLGEMLKGNTLLRELDVSSSGEGMPSSKRDGPGFAKELAVGIMANGALSVFTFSGDSSNSKAVTMKTSMTEADFSEKYLGVSGAIMLSAFLPKCM
jgi:hypothetical protein